MASTLPLYKHSENLNQDSYKAPWSQNRGSDRLWDLRVDASEHSVYQMFDGFYMCFMVHHDTKGL